MTCTGSTVSCNFILSEATCEELNCRWNPGIGCAETIQSLCRNVQNSDYCNQYGCLWSGPTNVATSRTSSTLSAPVGPTTAATTRFFPTLPTTSTTVFTTSNSTSDGGIIAGAVVAALFVAICVAAAIYTTIRERTRRKSENVIEMPRVDAAAGANKNAVPVQPALPPENPEFTRQYAASAPPPASQPEYMRTTNVGW